jgi:hypothetical protein
MGGEDSRVEDIGMHPAAIRVIHISGVERQVALVDPIESPRGAELSRGIDRHDLIGFDQLHIGIAAQAVDGRGGQRGGETLERGLVDEPEFATTLGHQLASQPGNVLYPGLEHDDIGSVGASRRCTDALKLIVGSRRRR